jgi:hypothetical protein
MKMTSNGKTLNYNFVNLVESYNFHIKFISILVKQKRDWTPTVVSHDGRKTLQYRAPPTAVGHNGRFLPPSPTAAQNV